AHAAATSGSAPADASYTPNASLVQMVGSPKSANVVPLEFRQPQRSLSRAEIVPFVSFSLVLRAARQSDEGAGGQSAAAADRDASASHAAPVAATERRYVMSPSLSQTSTIACAGLRRLDSVRRHAQAGGEGRRRAPMFFAG